MTNKKFLTTIIFGIFCVLLCFCICLPINIKSAYASSTGAGSFTTSMSADNEYCTLYKKNVAVQEENKIMYADNITINYTNSTKDSNDNIVMEAVTSVSVSVKNLGHWNYHRYEGGTFYVKIYVDDVEQETLELSLGGRAKEDEVANTYTLDMSSLASKYSYYTFSISAYYEVYWQWLWNNGTKQISYSGGSWRVNTPGIKGKVNLPVYNEETNSYTQDIQPNKTYKTDNKNTYFWWDTAQHKINTFVSITNLDGSSISEYYNEKTAGDWQNGGGFIFSYLPDGTYKINMRTDLGKTATYFIQLTPFEKLLDIQPSTRAGDTYFIENQATIKWDISKYSVSEIKLNGFNLENGSIIKPGELGLTWNVEYTVEVTRTTGSKDYYKIVFTNKEIVNLNLNQNSLTKSPIARWYETYLLDTTEKTYNSWASYENALKFAIQRETDTVKTAYYDGGTWIAGIGIDDPLNRKAGNYYIYKQRDNSTEQNAYFSIDALNSAIYDYAVASISNNTYYSKSTPATPHEGEQLFKTYVENGQQYNLYLLGSFTLSKRPYVSLWINNDMVDFNGAETITLSVPGQYKIDEINPFGDKVTYYIYIQRTAPEIQYIMKNTSLENTLTTENTRFGTYFDLILFDLDDDSLLIIEKKGIGSVAKVYTYKELLEILNKTNKADADYLFNQSGQYTITAVNHWTAFAHVPVNSFTFYVSVNEPYINEPTVDKEKNELTLSYGIPTGEYNVQITSVVIKKYLQAEDVWTTLTVDSKGTTISPDCTSYVFNTKGYYVIQITDNFARTYYREYAFSREKPTAIFTVGNQTVELSEDEVGYYNKKVSIVWYDNTITAKMYGVSYTWNNNIMIKQNLNNSTYESGTVITAEGYYIIELIDIDFNSRRFTFYIDQKAPTLILIANDKEIPSESYKNCDVKASYDEASEYETSISISVEKDGFPIAFPENNVFTEEGSYELKIFDRAGNTNTYKFTIDKTVPIGQLYLEDGTEFANNGVTNKKIYCSWAENGVTATYNDEPYYKGALIESAGIYRIVLTDKAGNSSVYNFEINKNIPIIVMKTESGKIISNNSTVDESFSISWEDPNYTYIIQIIKNGQAETFTNYTEMSSRMFKFSESGSYRFTFTNARGVSYIYSVSANMRPTAIITAGVETLKAYEYTNKNVTVTISDRNATIEVYKLDSNNEYKTYSNWQLNGFAFVIVEDGSYKIIVINDFNLMNNYFFSIKTTLPSASLTVDGNEIEQSKDILGTVKISYDKEEVVECKLYRNGEIVYGENDEISEAGRYTLVLTDKAGNQNTYTFTIVASNNLNWAGIVVLIALFVGIIFLAIFLIKKFRRPFKLK